MKSYPRRGSSGFRVTVGVMSLGIALFFSGMAHAAPQYSLSCIDCHQMPPLDSAAGARVPGTGAFKGNHQQHAGATAETCVKCHGAAVTDYPTSHRTKQIHVNGNINSSPAIGAYSRGFFNQTSVPPAALGSCTNVNCHFESTTDPWGVLPASTYTQVGANGTTCGKCHAAPPSDGNHPSAAPGPGKKHGDYFGTGTGSCIKCHPDHGVEPAPFSHATSAGKRGLVLQFTAAPNSGGTYSGDVSYPHYLPSQNPARNGNCSNLYCHSDGRGGAPKTTPTWGTTLPADCTGCHGGNVTTGANAMSTYQHQKHINNAGYIGTNYACGRCHSNTVDPANDQAITASGVSTYHVNGTPNVAFNNGGTYGGGTCSATLCHSAGKSAAPQPLVPSWTAGGSLDCKGCHGAGGSYGEPTYASGGLAADLANSHSVKHIKNAASCANCHANTTLDGVSIKSGSTSHTNGGIDVNFAATYDLGSAQYNSAINTKSCANIYCHSDGNGNAPLQTPQWGGSMTCTSCHGNNAASGSMIASGKHSAHLNNYTTLGRGNYFGCTECHAKTVDSDSHITTAGRANHANKMKDYSGARTGKIAIANSGKCSNNYCHSTGAKNNTFWNMTAANWYSSRTLGCTGCHGNASSPDFAPVAGTPNYANVTSAANTARNSHNRHVPGAGITDTTGCAKCHYRTVDAAIPGKLRNYSTQHLNGVRDVSFSAAASISGVQGRYSSTTQQCMNTYCHGGPKTPKWGSSSLACNQCHSADSTGFGANAGAHGAHYQVATPPAAGTYASMPAGEGSLATQTSYQFNCTSCHSSPATHANGPANANGVAQVYFGFSSAGKKGNYSYGAYQNSDNGFRWSAGKCSSTYCHSNGNGGFANMTSFTWVSPTGGATLGCYGCHGGNRASAKPIATGKHQAHMNNYTTLGTTFGCAECHAKTVGNDTTIGNKLLHVNKFKDFSGARAGNSSTYSYATGCSATYCHTSGKKGKLTGVTGYTEPAQPKWTDAAWTNKCNGCHGGATSVAGEPTYAGGIDGAVNANSHARHISQLNITDSTGCAVCHRTTVDPANPWRIVQSSSHLNGSIDVTFGASAGGGASYNGAGRTCSSVACHSDGNGSYGNPVWGSKLNCASCHPNLSGAHARHMGGIVLSAVPFYAYTANVSTGGDSFTLASYGFGCANCHPTDPSKHNNGVLDIELNASSGAGFLKMKNYSAALIGTVRTGGNVQCTGVYCHSDGRGGKNTTPLWNQTFSGLGVDRCAQCHGNSPTSGAHAAHVVGIHYNDVFNGYSSKVPQTANTTVASSHGDPNQSTTLNCNVCHANTVTYARNSQNTACVSCHNGDGATGMARIGNLAMHVNGTVDIALTNVTLAKSKAQLRPVYFADYTAAGGFWSRNGGNFKNGAAAFDSAKTLSGAPSYDKPSTTCSNINCHMGNPVNWKNKLECSDCHKVL